MRKILSVLCPCYNEEAVLPYFIERLTGILEEISEEYEIVFVNDGSTDGTLKFLSGQAKKDSHVRVVDFSRNFGKEAALTAALDFAKGDVLVVIDADLQDPPELIKEMVEKWREGYEVVLARRKKREHDGWFQRVSAKLFYRIINVISNPELPENVGDFRLMDKRVAEAIRGMRERNRFMKGILSWAGFRTAIIDHERTARVKGKSKFNLKSLIKLALEGITSFSTFPLSALNIMGSLILVAGITCSIYLFINGKLRLSPEMFVSMMPMGIQLIGIGVVGEYVGRIYIETKQRPIYVVREVIEHSHMDNLTRGETEGCQS